jgi:hypothetical protein
VKDTLNLDYYSITKLDLTMAKKVKPSTTKLTKKKARTEIFEKLSVLLATYKNGSDPKKFDRKLKKASKLFAPLVLKHGSQKAD